MALNARQLKLYIDTVDIYRPISFNMLEFGDIEELTIPTTPTYTDVECYRETKQEFGAPQPIGRSDKDILFTIDEFHFDVTQDLRTNDVLYFTTAGHPDYQQWFQVTGDTRVKTWRAEKHSVVVKRITKPHQKP